MEIHNLEINIQEMEVKLPVFLYSALIWRIFRLTLRQPLKKLKTVSGFIKYNFLGDIPNEL